MATTQDVRDLKVRVRDIACDYIDNMYFKDDALRHQP